MEVLFWFMLKENINRCKGLRSFWRLHTSFSVQQFTCKRSIINPIIIFVFYIFLILFIQKMIIPILFI